MSDIKVSEQFHMPNASVLNRGFAIFYAETKQLLHSPAAPVATGGHLGLSDLSACVGVCIGSFCIIVFSC